MTFMIEHTHDYTLLSRWSSRKDVHVADGWGCIRPENNGLKDVSIDTEHAFARKFVYLFVSSRRWNSLVVNILPDYATLCVCFRSEKRLTSSESELLADKSCRQGIVTGDHLNFVRGFFQLDDDRKRVWLKWAFSYDKSSEYQIYLCDFSSVSHLLFPSHLVDVLVGEGEDTASILYILEVLLVVVRR